LAEPGADDFRFNAVVAEEIAAFSLGVASCFSIHADVCPPYIVELGTEEQKRRWLPGTAAGELVGCIAMTEPSGGSDLAALKTAAVRDGENWVINGSKTFITNGYGADLIILAARTGAGEGSRGITLFVVEEGTPGFTRGRKLDKVGLDESDTSELFFDNVVAPDANRLGEVGQGFAARMRLLTQERLATSVTNIGQAELTRVFLDQCVLLHTQRELSAVDAAKLKWWSSAVQNEVADEGVQLHGGYGFMNEYRVARAWRDARITKIWGGTNEIMKELIGRDLGL
jgi:alkylation response protein AidB-like acyl-CoA dehydrogenase